MLNKYLRKNFWVTFFLDIFGFCVLFFSAYLIRFDLAYVLSTKFEIFKILPIIVIIKIVVMFQFDLYSGMWRYTGMRDLLNIIKATTFAFMITVIIASIPQNIFTFSRSVLIIDFAFGIFILSAIRVSIRVYFENFRKRQITPNKKRLLIIGAGDAGEKLLRDVIKNRYLSFFVVGFLDDDTSKIGHKIHGVTVLGAISKLQKIVKENAINQIIIAIPTASRSELYNVLEQCKKVDVKYRIIPSLNELISKKVDLQTARKVSYEDILGRREIKLDTKEIKNELLGKVVMITGAGGSIGSELSRQILVYEPKIIILFEIAETALFHIEMELKKSIPFIKVVSVIGDIKDKEHLKDVFSKYKPQIIYHAAAYKHVPLMEKQPWKAIQNNVFGTKTLIDVAKEYKVENFVLISTDKAVNPTSIMGASKKLTELLVLGNSTKDSFFSVVRFGNVLGSAGSVIPLFEKQIESGGPVTVTHPDIKRYFMTIPEASLLVLQSSAMNKGGQIFILDMGKQINIDSIAKEMIKFYGHNLGQDMDIEYIGLREGEKLFEELTADFEDLMKTSNKKINLVKSRTIRVISKEMLGELKRLVKLRDGTKVKEYVKSILNEYIYES